MLFFSSLFDFSTDIAKVCFSQQLKDDNEEYRVMYQPGPHGTPLHTLLVEGYVDGPLDTCEFGLNVQNFEIHHTSCTEKQK